MEQLKNKSSYRLNDEKLYNDILKLVARHAKEQKGVKILSMIRLKLKNPKPGEFMLEGATIQWKFSKQLKNGKRKS